MGRAADLIRTRLARTRDGVLRGGRAFELITALVFLATKLSLFWGRKPLYTGDRGVFARIGERALTDVEFWTAGRPFTTPLFHKLAGGNPLIVMWLQVATGAVAWLTLAYALSRLIPGKWSARVAFCLVLGLALTTGVHGWDFVIRSESLSNSFLALTLAALLNALRHAAHGDRRRSLAWSAGCLVFAAFAAGTRDTNAYVLLGFVGLVAWGAWFARKQRPWLVLGALVLGLLLVAVGSRKNAQLSGRHRISLTQVVFQRVLTHPRRLAYFRDRLGMPTSKVLLGRRGTWVSSHDFFAKKSPALAPFREWVAHDGYYGYQRYLLTHFGATFREAMRRFPAEAGNTRKGYTRRGENPVSRGLDFMIMRSVAWLPWLSVAFAACIGILAVSLGRKRGLHLLGALTLCAVGTAIVQGYVGYHGDAMEVSRHCLNVALFLQLAVVCAVVAAVALAATFLARARRGRTNRIAAAAQ
jgi:hypothetical protein